eukprot:TRINITY_DN7382_c0_g1_i1.p1 TRINITY_DN7382_c0_g1~~TRINITY_DN7382_c0_g1_i1.p1  ORF type:complete len:239 (+),score=-50.85 TRINITY_DN7382_c0_g1_i1:268-984(+)
MPMGALQTLLFLPALRAICINFWWWVTGMHLPQVVPFFKGLEWYEREAHDLCGCFFENSVDRRALLLPYCYGMHPLQKTQYTLKNSKTRGSDFLSFITWCNIQCNQILYSITPKQSYIQSMIVSFGSGELIVYYTMWCNIQLKGLLGAANTNRAFAARCTHTHQLKRVRSLCLSHLLHLRNVVKSRMININVQPLQLYTLIMKFVRAARQLGLISQIQDNSDTTLLQQSVLLYNLPQA